MKKGTPARSPWGEDIRKYYSPGGDDEEEPKGNHYWKKRQEEKKRWEAQRKRAEQGYGGFQTQNKDKLRDEIHNENDKAIKEYEKTGKTQRARCIYCLGSGKGERQITFGDPGHITPKCRNCDGRGVVPIPPGSVSRPHQWPQYQQKVNKR